MGIRYNTQNVYFNTKKKVIGVAFRCPVNVNSDDIVIIEITENT